MTHYFKTTKINDFIQRFHDITKIEIQIIKNLISLNLLDKILKNPESISIDNDCYFLSSPEPLNNYQNKIEFVFASYPIIDPNFEVLTIEDSEDMYKHVLINKKSKINSYLTIYSFDFPLKNAETIIQQHIHINVEHYSDHSTALLTKEELKSFTSFIKEKCEIYNFGYRHSDVLAHKFQSQAFLVLTFNLYSTNSLIGSILLKENIDIQEKINTNFSIYEKILLDIKKNHSKEIFSFFERALLEQTLEKF